MILVRYSLRQLRVHILCYGIGLGLYAALIAVLFPVMRETLDQLTETYPKEILEAFGLSGVSSGPESAALASLGNTAANDLLGVGRDWRRTDKAVRIAAGVPITVYIRRDLSIE